MDTIPSTLKEIGLSDKEIAIYLSLVELGSAPASTLGKRTGIHRSTAQYTCEQLVQKGLVSFSQKNNTFIYRIESVDSLLHSLHKEKQKIMQMEERVESVLPQLSARLQAHSTVPSLVSFEGKDALDKFYRALVAKFERGKEVLSYEYIPKEIVQKYQFYTYADRIRAARLAAGVSFKIVASYKDNERIFSDKKQLRESRYVDKETLNIPPSDTYIFEDAVCSVVFEDTPFAFIINNAFTARLQQSIFWSVWEQAEPF